MHVVDYKNRHTTFHFFLKGYLIVPGFQVVHLFFRNIPYGIGCFLKGFIRIEPAL